MEITTAEFSVNKSAEKMVTTVHKVQRFNIYKKLLKGDYCVGLLLPGKLINSLASYSVL